MSNEFAEATLYKIATGNYTPEELAAFLKALEALDEAAYVQVYNRLYEIVAQQSPGPPDERFKAPVLPMRTGIRWTKWLAAAAVLLVAGSAVYWFTTRNTSIKPVPFVTIKTTPPIDAAPGGNHATLTLSNGSVILLDQAATGDLAHQGGSRIVKSNNGQLVYYPATTGTTAIEYNTISTPRAGQYHIVLPDGTHVWLNAASSLRFPTSFTGKTREVEVSGEGYFEVVKNKNMPFKVITPPLPGGPGGAVQVLGTHFNINAYEDEEVAKVTLLEGSVKVGRGQQAAGREGSVILKPNEQATVTQPSLTTQSIPVQTVDVQKAIAWKDGFFEFNNLPLPAIMRQISRWYDVDVGMEASYPDKRFGGRISRKLNLASIISMLETYGVHFKMENKKLIVI
ncbi:FecR family protein [Niastella yeongjuensis]|nr:FecR family protein [Niastella yeongjuensis]SEO59252.1 FecR family protein [Niastella yeongjuensis]